MLPVIAIVGRPNVGKSTLFNRLTRARDAIVADRPGITRDRQHGFARHGDRHFIVMDTGGVGAGDTRDPLSARISSQALQAAGAADVIIWLLDGREGLTGADRDMARHLRPLASRLLLVVNKTEGLDPHLAIAEFFSLGLGTPCAISAEHGDGIGALLDAALPMLGELGAGEAPDLPGPRVCVIGRPNVGKSTLVNRMVGEERMLTFDEPGTTRDSILVPFRRREKDYVLVDTAGIRRRTRITDQVERTAVLKALQALDVSTIAIAVIDAREGIVDQDIALLGLAADSGKSLIIAVNKWDGLSEAARDAVRGNVRRRLGFVDYACLRHISALHGTGVGRLFDTIDAIAAAQSASYKSSAVTAILREAVTTHEPPMVRGRRIKLRYAHVGGHHPLRVIVHGNQTEHVPAAYRRYLAGRFRRELKLVGTPVMVEFKRGDNPYKGRKKKSGGKAKARPGKRRRDGSG